MGTKSGGSFSRSKGRRFSIAFIIIVTTILLWAWEKAASSINVLPPKNRLEIKSSGHVIRHDLNTRNGEVFSAEVREKEAKAGKSVTDSELVNEHNIRADALKQSGLSPLVFESVWSHDKRDYGSSSPFVKKGCNYAKGKWVADSRRPLYSGFECKQWLSEAWACRLTQRTDFSYEGFRWQPENCEMPEFDGSSFLKRMQHKTLAIVGDSLGRQQFQSLMCMVTGGENSTEVEDVGWLYGLAKSEGAKRPDGWAFRFPATNTTILYYWSATLCDIEPMNITDSATDYAMHLDRPPAFLQHNLQRFNVLVLNTGHHWNRGKLNANQWVMHVGGEPLRDRKLAQVGNAKNLTVFSAVKWLDSQLSYHPQIKAFFRTISPRHFYNGEWNTGGTCDNTASMTRGNAVAEDESHDPVVSVAVRGTRVRLLDITALSELRSEGHISRYSVKAAAGVQDCLHWCLPGIPDTWNEILAAQL